jgi:hypothetical protein
MMHGGPPACLPACLAAACLGLPAW